MFRGERGIWASEGVSILVFEYHTSKSPGQCQQSEDKRMDGLSVYSVRHTVCGSCHQRVDGVTLRALKGVP